MKLFVLFFLCVSQVISTPVDTLDYVYPPEGAFLGRIVGGQDAEEGEAPYQCSMQMYGSHFCGCAIISPKWILTAAHCVAGQRPEAVKIVVGTNDWKKGGTNYQSKKFIKHEKHNSPMFAYDIALILVDEDIIFDDLVQPIEIGTEEVPENTNLTLTGWGRLAANAGIPRQLQIINLKSISNKKCKSKLGKIVHESHLCTFNKRGEGACNGDSGGPLVFEDKVVGVVNFGRPCAVGMPDAFGSVHYFNEWIQSTIEDNEDN